MTKYTEYGVNVRAELLRRGVTVTELSKQLGISVSYLADILKGNRNGKKQKVRINEILGIESY